MAEDPKPFLKRMAEAQRKAVKKCFYYPCCGSDLIYPLQHFSRWCENFIFCDWNAANRNSFRDQINSIKAERPEGIPDVAPDFFASCLHRDDKELADMEDILAKFFRQMPPRLRRFLAHPSSQERDSAELWITASDGEPKFVRVSWLAMEGVNIYWKLFAHRGLAPRILCLKNWGRHDDDESWTPFGEWQEHLGQVVRDSHSEPEFLVAREGDHDWPWTKRVDEFNDWGDRPVILWARQKPTPLKRPIRERK
jgi:hypothetical protein